MVIEVNKWELIFDFTKDEKTMNFAHLDPADFKIINKSIEGFDQKPSIVFPYPERYGGTLDDHAIELNEKKDEGMMAFGFNVSQKDAAQKLEQKI